MCDTRDVAAYEASERLRAARDAAREAETVYEAALEELRQAIVAELSDRKKPADVGMFVGWHPSHVRKLARKANVPPLVDVEPPRRRRPASPEPETGPDHDG